LKKEKDEVLEKLRVARYSVTAYENEREEFQAMLQEDKEKLQREIEQFLAEHIVVKEVVNTARRFVPVLTQEE
jgi:hypothetical protein